MDKKSLLHYRMEMPVPYSFHSQIQKEAIVWSGTRRCARNHPNTVRV